MAQRTAVRDTAAHSAYVVADQQIMAAASRYLRWQRELIEPHLGQRVLEIGCGVGNMTAHLTDRRLVVGVDIDGACVAEHRRRFQQARNVLSLHADFLAADRAEWSRFGIDTVVCLNVLEHLDDDRAALRTMRSALPRGGAALILVPAFMSLFGPIDQLVGHHRRYTRDTVAARARAAGFDVESVRYVNTLGFFGWWWNAKVARRTMQSEAQVKVFDRYLLPAQSRVERRVRLPLGQSVFAVLRAG